MQRSPHLCSEEWMAAGEVVLLLFRSQSCSSLMTWASHLFWADVSRGPTSADSTDFTSSAQWTVTCHVNLEATQTTTLWCKLQRKVEQTLEHESSSSWTRQRARVPSLPPSGATKHDLLNLSVPFAFPQLDWAWAHIGTKMKLMSSADSCRRPLMNIRPQIFTNEE